MAETKVPGAHTQGPDIKEQVVHEEVSISEGTLYLDRQTVLRLDLVLMPMTLLLYLLAWIDRANVGNARVAGLANDLELTDRQYKTAITVTYLPYILAELPSNLLIKRIGPRILLSTLCTVWGLVATLQSQVHNYAGFVACRFFLGLVEGGLFPGIVLYLSSFYRRHELQMRIALFFSAASLSGAFSGLLAAAIEQMNGLGRMKGWQWIFLLEGLATICFGIFAFFILPNRPKDVLSFRPEHVETCLARLELDGNFNSLFSKPERVTIKDVTSVLTDLHVWIVVLILFCNGCCSLGLAYFSPSIVQALGYTKTKTQLMTVPPYACAFIVTMISSYIADRRRQRGITALITSVIALVGALLAINGQGTGLRYAALVLLVTGSYACAPCLISWVPNNTAGHVRRATAVAMAFIASNVGGIVSTWIYPQNSAPLYHFAMRFNLSLILILMVLVVVQVLLLRTLNKRKALDAVLILQGMEHLSYEEQMARLGDHHPDYRYTY